MPVRDKRRVDPERDRLVDQRHIAENELGEIEAQISAVAVAATEGDGSAFKKDARLDKEATRLRAQAALFERAIVAFDKSRAAAAEVSRQSASPLVTSGERNCSTLKSSSRDNTEAVSKCKPLLGENRGLGFWSRWHLYC